jgi:serine/threonine-protein kinase
MTVIAGKYEVRGVLGEGLTGIVYDAMTADGEPVAVKVMHAQLAGDRQIRGRFQREAVILRRLEGAHVCPILDFGEVPGETPQTSVLYMALPRIDGPSLADVLARGPIDVGRAIEIVFEILDALTSAHAQGVIHRDLKPANVLLKHERSVVVVDFGMAKIVTGSGLGTTNLTAHNMLFGTPEYMSPEQARGDELDPRCDVYAAGVILYEMLTGAQPFTGDTPLQVLTAHLTSPLPSPSSRPGAAGRITPALEMVVQRALARDRDERYRSAAELRTAIAMASKRPSHAPEAFAATVPSTVDVSGPTLVAPGPVKIASAPPPRPPARPSRPPSPSSIPSRPPPEPPDSTRTWLLVWVVVGLLSIAAGVWFALR